MPRKPAPVVPPKVMDVAKPSGAKSSKAPSAPVVTPLVISHRAIIKDGNEPESTNATDEQTPAQKPKAEPLIKKIQLQPLAPATKFGDNTADTAQDETEDEAESVTVQKPGDMLAAARTGTAVEITVDEPETPDSAPEGRNRPTDTQAAGRSLEAQDSTPADKLVGAASANAPAGPDASDGAQSTNHREASTDSAAKTDPSVQSNVAAGDASPAAAETDTDTPAGTEELLPGADQTDPSAAKAAREAAEKQLALDKLVSDETYLLPVGTVHRRRQVTLLLVLLVILVLVIVGALVALDAGYIHIDGFPAPTDLIKN